MASSHCSFFFWGKEEEIVFEEKAPATAGGLQNSLDTCVLLLDTSPTFVFLLFPVKLLRRFFNKYLIAGSLFAVWMLFFDRNDYMSQQRAKKQLSELRQSIDYLNRDIEKMDSERNAMLNNPQALEKFAREKYRMKRDGEDLYVVQP